MSDTFQRRFGPWALVTGASSGIGRAFAIAAAGQGLDVVLVARRQAELGSVAATIREVHGRNTRILVEDLGDPEAPGRLLQATADLDVGLLVAAAGFGSSGPFLDADVAVEANMVDVNCRASLVLTHGFGRRLVSRGRGGIVLLSSIVAFQGAPFAANYAATKAYVQSLAEGLRVEFAPHGVRVVACAPGPIESGFAARAGMRIGRSQKPEVVAHATIARLDRAGTVRPGWLAKLLGGSLSMLPRAGRVRAMGKIMAGMSKEQ